MAETAVTGPAVAMEVSQTRQRTIVITAMGTRGDVQPFVALGLFLQQERGWKVLLAVPPEYRSFVEAYGLEADDIGISLQHAVSASPQGRALRTAGALTAFQATRDFFRLPLLESWFASVRHQLLQLRPDVLLLSGFVAMSGAGALPQLLGLPTRIILAYTIPMSPTADFGVPLAGTGFTAPAAWLNRLQWEALGAGVSQCLHTPRAQQIVDEAVADAAAAGSCSHSSSQCDGSCSSAGSSSPTSILSDGPTRRIVLGRNLIPNPATTIYIYSSHLLPKPADWPAQSHVVGPLLLRRCQAPQSGAAGAGVGLPAALQDYLDAATRAQLPVVYIGLGSMLGTVFEADEVRRLVGCMQSAVVAAAARVPLCAVIHTTLVPGSSDKAEAAAAAEAEDTTPRLAGAHTWAGQQLPTFMLLTTSVPHELLLPQVDLCIHHGGAGTTQAALLAGKPSLVVPCVPSSDQSFWADLVHRRGLGPYWFPVRRLTAERLAAGIEEGMLNLRQYTAAAEALAVEMAGEDGVAAAAKAIEAVLAGP